MSEEPQPTQPTHGLILEDVHIAKSNGLKAQSTDEDILTELTTETVGQSYGYVRLKFTHGDKVSLRRIKVQPIDAMRLGNELDAMPQATKEKVLKHTEPMRSLAFSDDLWLQSLGAACYAFAPPMVLKNAQQQIVWVAGGKPQNLAKAMQALCDIGLSFWHIRDISDAIIGLNRHLIATEEDDVGNS